MGTLLRKSVVALSCAMKGLPGATRVLPRAREGVPELAWFWRWLARGMPQRESGAGGRACFTWWGGEADP
jgi:hypothetical protein